MFSSLETPGGHSDVNINSTNGRTDKQEVDIGFVQKRIPSYMYGMQKQCAKTSSLLVCEE
jgi:hypothetical protein